MGFLSDVADFGKDIFSSAAPVVGGILGGPIGAGLGTAAAGIFGADKAADANQQLRQFAEFKPFDVTSQFGQSNIDPATGQIRLQTGSSFDPLLQQLGQSSLEQLRDARFDPTSLLSSGQRTQAQTLDQLLGNIPAEFGGISGAALGGAQDVLGAFRNFDPDAFAATQKGRLDELARPGEENLVNRNFNRLFGSGQLGTTGGADQLAQIAQGLERGQTERGLASIGLAGREQSRLSGLARNLFGTGLAANQIPLQRQEARFNLANTLFNQGVGREASLANRFTGAFNPLLSLQQNLLDQANLGLAGGAQQSVANLGAATPLAQQRAATANAIPDLIGPALGAGIQGVGDFFSGFGQPAQTTQPSGGSQFSGFF
jgi:hypothetical protein